MAVGPVTKSQTTTRSGLSSTMATSSRAGVADRAPLGPVTRSQTAAHTASVTTTMLATSAITPKRSTLESDSVGAIVVETSPLLAGGDESHDGLFFYRHIDDILRNAWRVEFEEEFVEEEAFLVKTEEPSCYREAAGQPDWENAMGTEIESIEKNSTWSLVKLPARHINWAEMGV